MDKFINKEIENIKTKLDLIIKQNSDIQIQLEKISTALLQTSDTGTYNIAIEEFLTEFMNNYP